MKIKDKLMYFSSKNQLHESKMKGHEGSPGHVVISPRSSCRGKLCPRSRAPGLAGCHAFGVPHSGVHVAKPARVSGGWLREQRQSGGTLPEGGGLGSGGGAALTSGRPQGGGGEPVWDAGWGRAPGRRWSPLRGGSDGSPGLFRRSRRPWDDGGLCGSAPGLRHFCNAVCCH